MAPTPWDVIVRFSTANPDLVLHITSPSTTSTLALKQQIRSKLDSPAAESRLRLIHGGKVLQDTAALSKNLTPSAPPPTADDVSKSSKAKGKQPIREKSEPVTARVYIHCSIGDVLSPGDLAAEATQAHEADAALKSTAASPSSTPANGLEDDAGASTTTPEARGFDRLLSAGFTPAEVAALRAQFLAIQAHTHTPDTMPSGPELLALEERWLDNGSNPGVGGADDAGGAEDAGGLEDMLYGNLTGFFWPIGAMFWLMREEGVWSRRRQMAVLSGFLVNLTFGFLKIIS